MSLRRCLTLAAAAATAAVLTVAPSASALTIPPPDFYITTPGIYTNGLYGAVLVYDGSGQPTDITPELGHNNAGETAWDAAVSPDGATLYTVFSGGSIFWSTRIAVQDVESGTLQRVIPIANASPLSPKRIAISPDGSTAYVSVEGVIYPVDLASGGLGTAIRVPNMVALALAPDGKSLYVSAGTHLQRINLRNGAVVGDLDLRQPVGAIKVSADGATVYALGDADGTTPAHLFKISQHPFKVTDQALLPGTLDFSGGLVHMGLALSPYQNLLYVTGVQNSPALTFAVPVTASDLQVGPVVHLLDGISYGTFLDAAFTPDGNTLYAHTTGDQGFGYLVTLDVANNSVTSTARAGSETSVLTPPSQPLEASFDYYTGCAGAETKFIASPSSTDPATSPWRYHWDFGDGAQLDTSSDTVSHTYADAGQYTAALTVTDSTGTWTTVVYDGQTVLRNGSSIDPVSYDIDIC